MTLADRLECRFEPQDWPFAQLQAEAIDAHWRRWTNGNPHIFNGRILLLHAGGTETAGDGARIFRGAFSETEFKALLYWRGAGFPDSGRRNVFAMAALQASDGAFVLGEMGAHTANPGQIYFPAGTPDRDDIVDGKVDLEGSVWRELAEETGLAESDATAAHGWTLVEDGGRLACMRRLRSPLPATELIDKISAFHESERGAGGLPEFARMHLWRRAGDVAPERMPGFMRAYLEAAQPG